MRSIKESGLDRMVLIGESSLHRATSEFVLHYHAERNHQGLGNKIIRPEFAEFPNEGTINCRERLGGLLRLVRLILRAPLPQPDYFFCLLPAR